LTTLGVALASNILGITGAQTDMWNGQAVNVNDVLVMYTYAGDANLDGVINGGDYGVIDNFIQVAGVSGYANGDFNYDGVIDGGDYGVIDNNIQAQGAPLSTSSANLSSAVTAVPEPSACGFAILTVAALTARRPARALSRKRKTGNDVESAISR
jgi:hypothetical protein